MRNAGIDHVYSLDDDLDVAAGVQRLDAAANPYEARPRGSGAG